MTHLPTKLGPAADRVYWATHKWIRRKFDKAGLCEHCGVEKKTEWARKDHNVYSRERGDWMELCRSCHRRHDDEKYGRAKKRLRTHCRQGHEFTEQNTYRHPNVGRRCRTCVRLKAREERKKLRWALERRRA